MARQETDREDLLREATALVERVELSVAGLTVPVVVGFRRGGEGSVYFGVDPVYQFNRACELRRAFRGGRLLKAERRRLVYLDRQRTATEVRLVRQPLDAAATSDVLAEARQELQSLLVTLQSGGCQVIGCVPAKKDVAARVVDWLLHLPEILAAADTPHVAISGRNE